MKRNAVMYRSVLLFLISFPVFSYSIPTIAIKFLANEPLEPSNRNGLYTLAKDDIDSLKKALSSRFTNSRRFIVLNNNTDILFDMYFEEQAFKKKLKPKPLSVDELKKFRRDHHRFAQFFLVCRVQSASFEKFELQNPYSRKDPVFGAKSEIGLSVELVDTTTREVVISETMTKTKVSRHLDDFSFDLSKLKEEVVNDIVDQVIQHLEPIKVVQVISDHEVLINVGKDSAYTIGSQFEVFKKGDAVINPDTGEFLGYDHQSLGVLEITRLEKKFSRAKVIKKADSNVEQGTICREL